MTSATAFGQPDEWRRVDKSVWRQQERILLSSVARHAEQSGVDQPSLTCIGVPSTLVAAIEKSTNCSGYTFESLAEPGGLAQVHMCLMMGIEAMSPVDRVAALERAVPRIRPGGELILLLDVVATPRSTTIQPPGVVQLLDEITTATGGAVQLDEFRSVRWANEPIHRGALLELAMLTRAQVSVS